MITHIWQALRNKLIKFLGGETKEDLCIARGQVMRHYEKRLQSCFKERDKARHDYAQATTRIRDRLQQDVFGYAKRDIILRRREEFIEAMRSAIRKEAFDYFDRWEKEDSNE